MKLTDLLRLRWALLAAVVMILAGVQLVWWAQGKHETSRTTLRQVEEAYRRGHARLQQAERDEAQIRDTIGRFRSLEGRGVVGPEQRLEWIERLRAIRDRLRLPALDYELRPRRPLEAGNGPAEAYQLSASTLWLRATLVHEEDLLRLLADLRGEPSAIVRPTQCRMTRPATASAGLLAECELELLTVTPGPVR